MFLRNFTGGLACHGGPHVGPHTLTACWRKPYRGCRGRRSSRGRDQLAQGQRGRGACPHPKVFKEPGTRAPWVRPTTPPAAPSGHRGRPTWGATASPHAQGPRSLADQSGACLQAAGRSLLGPGDNAVELPRPGQTGPLPRRKAPGIPSKIQLV